MTLPALFVYIEVKDYVPDTYAGNSVTFSYWEIERLIEMQNECGIDDLPCWDNRPVNKPLHLMDHYVSSLIQDGLIYGSLPEV